MTLATAGLHHVTAIARDARANLAFYAGVLGLHLVKRTVNFDEASTFHLYYGDAAGRPGTLLTFFVRTGEATGSPGGGQATSVGFTVPRDSLSYWKARLRRHGVLCDDADSPERRSTLTCADPDGLRLELVAVGDPEVGTPLATVPGEAAIQGLHRVELSTFDHRRTRAFFTDAMGFTLASMASGRSRLVPAGGAGGIVDVVPAPASRGVIGAGSVHHVAFRARDVREQLEWQQLFRRTGLDVTDVRNRKYFQSIYFDEPGGVRCEVATDQPGFAVDESPDRLGRRLQLPAALEARRADLEARLGLGDQCEPLAH